MQPRPPACCGFLAYMEDDDGRLGNFILDWSGRRNRREARHRCHRQTPQLRTWICVRCRPGRYGALARTASPADRPLAWSREFADYSSGSGLLNTAGCSRFIYGPLAGNRAGGNGKRARPFGAHRMYPRQRRSAAPAAQSNPTSISNACCRSTSAVRPRGLAAVAGATSSARYSTAAARSRLRFHGRNTAGQPVCDAQRDMVYDGIDTCHVSRNSGAESNIEALALLG
jgi:hypothetical protein